VIYIGGCGRSGSTLLERALGTLPGTVAVGELFLLGRRGVVGNEVCGCGEAFADCPFWIAVCGQVFAGRPEAIEELVRLQRSVDRNRHIPAAIAPFLPPSARRRRERYLDVLGRLYRSIADVSGCHTVIDSSKHASTAFLLHRLQSVDVHVVHLIRDSRGVAYSWTKIVARPEIRCEDAFMQRSSPPLTALRWLLDNSLIAALERMGQATTRVRYEDFVRYRGRELGRILEGAGADPQPSGTDPGRSRVIDLPPCHSVAGNPMRFRSGPVDLVLDDEWRRRLPRHHRHLVTAITAPMLGAYGYLGPTVVAS